MRCGGCLGALLLAAGVLFTGSARAQHAPGGEVEAEARERAALLAQVLPDAVHARSFWLFPPLIIGSGAVLGTFGALEKSPLIVASGAVAVSAGVGFYAVPEQRNYELLAAGTAASAGLFYWGLPFGAQGTRWQYPIGAGYLALSALGFVNFAYSTNPGRTRLVRDLARVRTPAARSSLDVAELRQLELDLYGTDFFVPQWALGLPLIVSGVVAAAPVLDPDVRRGDKLVIGAMAAATLLQGVTISLVETPAARYRSSLQRAGLWANWGVGPGGVSVVGGFD